jgi:RNA-directed DNA polymerase
MNEPLKQEIAGKESNRTPAFSSPEKSDEVVVLKNPANKGVLPPAEQVEERTSTERNSEKPIVNRTLSRGFASQGLDRVRHRAEQDKGCVFNNLFQFLKVDLLRWSFYQLKRNSAPGLDGITWWMYEKQLESRLPELECELHTGRYRATPDKREYITKENGDQRPIGIQAVEDKVVQRACVTILNEVYEPLFCGFSYGFRPERSQHMALDALHEGICRRKISWIVDCDIKAFFDTIDHDLLMGMLEKRVGDKRLLRLLQKWLRLGWEEDGFRTPRTVGTAQGSVISPLLANIVLSEVMDRWFIQWRKEAKGDCIMVRFADDAVMGFQHEREASAFLGELAERLKAHGLTQSRKLKEIKFELIRRINENLSNIGKWLGSVMRGVTNYYAVPGNMDAVKEFYTQLGRHWLWVIRRRSHKARKRWTWERFYRLQEKYIPRPRLAHPYPSDRFDVTHSR